MVETADMVKGIAKSATVHDEIGGDWDTASLDVIVVLDCETFHCVDKLKSYIPYLCDSILTH